MGDMGDYWRETKDIRKEQSQERKSRNFDNAIKRLKSNDVEFEIMGNGIHLVVRGKSESIDYWPTTGKFICRGSNKTGRGINGLLKAAKQ